MVPENHGYQVIHRLQMFTMGREFANEFRYREDPLELDADKPAGLTGDYLNVDLVQVAAGLGARAIRATTSAEVRSALEDTRSEQRPVVIVVPVIPHADLPSAGCWWDVAPAEVGESDTVAQCAQRLRDRPRYPEVARMSDIRYALDRGNLKARLARGEATYGTFLGAGSAVTAEVCAAAGVDWVLLDLEHGGGGEEQASGVVPAAASYGVPTVVRAESTERIRAGRLLDLGAAGVMFPRIDGPEDAASAISHLRYPPLGDRGVATYNRMCHYGLDPSALDRSDDEVLGVVQIETAGALATVEEIAALDGVDVLFVGPRDLSLALGVPGDLNAPVYVEALERVLAAARRTARPPGLLVPNGAAAATMTAAGWQFLAIGSDTTILGQRDGRRAATSGDARMTTLAKTDIVVALGEVDARRWSVTTCPADATFVAEPTAEDLAARHGRDRTGGRAGRRRAASTGPHCSGWWRAPAWASIASTSSRPPAAASPSSSPRAPAPTPSPRARWP